MGDCLGKPLGKSCNQVGGIAAKCLGIFVNCLGNLDRFLELVLDDCLGESKGESFKKLGGLGHILDAFWAARRGESLGHSLATALGGPWVNSVRSLGGLGHILAAFWGDCLGECLGILPSAGGAGGVDQVLGGIFGRLL